MLFHFEPIELCTAEGHKPLTCGDMFLKSMACRPGTNIAVVDKPPERFETPTTKETITRLCVYGALAFAAFAIRQKLLR